MARVITTRRWSQQPQCPVQVCDYLADIAVVGMHPCPYPMDTVRAGRPQFINGGATIYNSGNVGMTLNSPVGTIRRHAAVTDYTSMIEGNGGIIPQVTTECTVFCFMWRNDTVSRDFSDFGVDNASGGNTTRLTCAFAYENSLTIWDFGGISGNQRLLISSGITSSTYADPHLMICTAGPRGMEVYRDLTLQGSQAGVPTARSTAGTASRFGLNRGPNGTSTDNSTSNWLSFLLLNKQLSIPDINSIARDYWRIFKPLGRVMYALAPVIPDVSMTRPVVFTAM